MKLSQRLHFNIKTLKPLEIRNNEALQFWYQKKNLQTFILKESVRGILLYDMQTD